MKRKNKSRNLGIISLVFGAISFVPLLGLFTGIVAIILGILSIKREDTRTGRIGLILGIIGILITVGLYGAIFYFGFVQRGGAFDDMRSQMVREQDLPNAINMIEAYKARFGQYPNTIEDLKNISTSIMIADQTQIAKFMSGSNTTDTYFYYETRGDTYYLFSKGVDGKPFTEDDIYPVFSGDAGNIGYRTP